jgi:hypothetical protein
MRQRVVFDDQLVIPFSDLTHSPSISRYTSCDSSFNRTAKKGFEKFIGEVRIDLSRWKSGFDGSWWGKDLKTSCMIPSIAIQTKSLSLLVRTKRFVAD